MLLEANSVSVYKHEDNLKCEPWSQIELDTLHANYKLSVKQIMKLIPNRSYSAIKTKRLLLCLPHRINYQWTKQEDEFLRELWTTGKDLKFIANEYCQKFPERSHRSPRCIYDRLKVIGCHYSKTYHEGRSCIAIPVSKNQKEMMRQDAQLAGKNLSKFFRDLWHNYHYNKVEKLKNPIPKNNDKNYRAGYFAGYTAGKRNKESKISNED